MQITHSMLVLHAMPHWAPYVNSLAFRREKILCQDDGGSQSSEAGERRKKNGLSKAELRFFGGAAEPTHKCELCKYQFS